MKNEDFFSFQDDKKEENRPADAPADAPADGTPTDDGAFFMPPIGEDGQMRIPHGMTTGPQRGTNLPLISLILALLSFCCCGIPLSVASIVVAVISRNKLGRWDGLAIAGIVISVFGILMYGIIFALVFISELMLATEGELLSLLPLLF